MIPTIVDEWKVKDRGDGAELQFDVGEDFDDRKLNMRDEQLKDLISDLQKVVEADNRPVNRGERFVGTPRDIRSDDEW